MKRIVLVAGFFILFCFFKKSVQAKLTDVVETSDGPVRGEILTTVQNSVEYASFKGIPYGKPPVGYRRFKPPEAADSWTEILYATAEPNPCPQINDNVYGGEEDCLYLNVYTPKITVNSDKDELLAVMIWIYGGAFTTGQVNASYYGPDFLIEDNVVVVAMNYRLGPLGFLSLNHVNATGNAGLKDQVLAMKWVQKNIKNFGGDPSRVTIFGESAGSVAVELHKISDLSSGLFNRSIAMSGSPLNFWGFYSISTAKSRAFHLGRNLGLITLRKTTLLKKLYEVTAEELISAADRINVPDIAFKPTYENSDVAEDEIFLSDCAVERYQSGNVDGLPHILGFTRSETMSFASSLTQFKGIVDQALSSVASLSENSLTFLGALNGVMSSTVDDIEDLGTDMLYDAVNVTTDLLFIEGIDRTQQYLTADSSAPVYYYRNSLPFNISTHWFDNVNLNGTGHGDDLLLIFWTASKKWLDSGDIYRRRRKMVRMWTNFAKYGNPTPDAAADTLLNTDWTQSGAEGYYLEIGENLTMVDARPTDGRVKRTQQAMTPFQRLSNGCPLW